MCRLARIFYEIYELFLLLKFHPRIITVVGASIDMLVPFLYSKIFRSPMIAVFHGEVPARGFINRFAAKIVNSPDVFTITNGELPKDQLIALGAYPEKIARYKLEKIVRILGMRPSNMIYSYLSNADIVLVPSYLECFGKILAEAMMSGAVPISYDTGGLAYQITDGVNGFLVRTGDYETMAHRVIELYKNPEMREEIARNASKVREKYRNIEQTLGHKLKKLIDDLLDNRNK